MEVEKVLAEALGRLAFGSPEKKRHEAWKGQVVAVEKAPAKLHSEYAATEGKEMDISETCDLGPQCPHAKDGQGR